MKCPLCNANLVRTAYESLAVHHCEACFGYLLGRHRVEAVKIRREKSTEELKKEVASEGRPDTSERIRCPYCRRKMHKEYVKKPADFNMDVCPDCDIVWFDGGELARLQLAYENSPKGIDAERSRRRMAEMTLPEWEEFERNLAKLPAGNMSIASIFAEGIGEGLLEGFAAAQRNRRFRWK